MRFLNKKEARKCFSKQEIDLAKKSLYEKSLRILFLKETSTSQSTSSPLPKSSWKRVKKIMFICIKMNLFFIVKFLNYYRNFSCHWKILGVKQPNTR